MRAPPPASFPLFPSVQSAPAEMAFAPTDRAAKMRFDSSTSGNFLHRSNKRKRKGFTYKLGVVRTLRPTYLTCEPHHLIRSLCFLLSNPRLPKWLSRPPTPYPKLKSTEARAGTLFTEANKGNEEG